MLLVLVQLVVFVGWSYLLWTALQVLLRRIPALAQWPAGYWLVLLCCSLPLWPPLQWQQDWIMPPQLLQQGVGTAAYWVAAPMHPGLQQKLGGADLLVLLVFTCWISGAAWRLWQLIRQWRQLQLLCRKAQAVSAIDLLTGINETSAAGLTEQLGLLQLKQQGASSAFVFGFFRLHLVLPANFVFFPPAERLLLLQHELCHVRRRDPQQLLCWRLLGVLCWFNPVVQKLETAFIRAMELSVDRQVLAQQPELALSYGKAMLTSLKYQQHASQVSAGFTGQTFDEQFYRQRLSQLFQPVPLWPAGKLLLLALVTLLMMACCHLVLSQFSWQRAAPEQWQWPLQQVAVNSGYGVKSAIRQYKPHLGLDLAGRSGDHVLAVAPGRVLIADDNSLDRNFGLVVLLDHGDGYQTLYAHLQQSQVKPGDKVAAGELIGGVGSSGKATGPHLHFELLHFGVQQDPMLYLPALP